jgi:hypothetical protein
MKARTGRVFAFTMGTVLGIAAMARSSDSCSMGQQSALTVQTVKKNGVAVTVVTTDPLGLLASPDGAANHLAAIVLDPETQLSRRLVLVRQ